MEIIFKGRQTDVPERFRKQAAAKLNRLEKLDQKAIRVDVEVSVERNPRQASQKERVELTVSSRGPAIRAEAAAEDRFSALDLAIAKLDARLRRALDRRKNHYAGHGPVRLVDLPENDTTAPEPGPSRAAAVPPPARRPADNQNPVSADVDDVVPIEMEGDGPLVVRQKLHHATPMAIDQALLAMELVGHDFYLFHDIDCGLPSVVYKRRGYHYGVIRLVDNAAGVPEPAAPARATGRGRGSRRGVRRAGVPQDRPAEPAAANGQPENNALRRAIAAMFDSR